MKFHYQTLFAAAFLVQAAIPETASAENGVPVDCAQYGGEFADQPYGKFISLLCEEGFDHLCIKRTLLGRVRIVAENARTTREIVLTRVSGEVLRDLLSEVPQAAQSQSNPAANMGQNPADTPGPTGASGKDNSKSDNAAPDPAENDQGI